MRNGTTQSRWTAYGGYGIARQYGIPEETAALMEQASLLHDVGKIGISDEILLKKGKLTPEEVELIQSHCKILYGNRGMDNATTCRARSGSHAYLRFE